MPVRSFVSSKILWNNLDESVWDEFIRRWPNVDLVDKQHLEVTCPNCCWRKKESMKGDVAKSLKYTKNLFI